MRIAFCGHSRISDIPTVTAALKIVVADLISTGATEFYLGGYGEFDSLAAKIVHDAKADCPYIKSILVIPYLDQKYDPNYYDNTVYPPLETVPRKVAIVRRNEWMVEQADVLVACVTHDFGGAATMLKYAKRKKKRIIYVV